MMARKWVIAVSLVVVIAASLATGMTFNRWLDAQRAIRGVGAHMISFRCHPEDPQRFTVEVLLINVSEEPIVIQHLFTRLYGEGNLIATLNLTHQDLPLDPGDEHLLEFQYATRLRPDQLPPRSACQDPGEWHVEMWLEVEHRGYRGTFQFPARARYRD